MMNSGNLFEIFLNISLLFVEIIGFLFGYYLLYTASGAFEFRYKSQIFEFTPEYNPFFTIIIPSHGTSFKTLKITIEGVLAINYPKYEIIVSDNGKDPEVTKNLQKFCIEKKIPFYHKHDTRGFKAGNINAVLTHTKGDLIVILDSDHIPTPDILEKFSKVMSDKNVGYVQAKVRYRNTYRLYQAANSILYSQFYEVFESSKDRRGVVLFNGTTGCFRKNILTEIDGFSEETFIEDIDTSIKILSNGGKGRYIDHIGSTGLVPETAKSQVSQLWRWAHGACHILRIRTRSILSSKLKWAEKLELILNAFAFFSGISIVAFITILCTMIILNIPILRPYVLGLNLAYLMPSLVSLAYLFDAFLAIYWEERTQPVWRRILHLIPFILFSMGAFLYLITGVVEGLLLKNTPLSETSVWNREFHVIRDSLIALIFSINIILIGIWGWSQSGWTFVNNFSSFVIGGAATWLLAPLVLLKEEFFPPSI